MPSVTSAPSHRARALRRAMHRAANAPVTLAAPDASLRRSVELAPRIAPLLQRLSEHLGLRVLEIRGSRLPAREISGALERLLDLLEIVSEPASADERGGEGWRWERIRLTLRRIHATRLILDPAAGSAKMVGDRLTIPLPCTATAIEPLRDASHPGGLCLNLIAWNPSDGVTLRPMETPLINDRGESRVAGDPEAQRQLAVSFWHPAWAVGAMRVAHGETRPTAFLPLERSATRDPLDFTVEESGRTLHGESAIVHTLRTMACAGRLLWDPRQRHFLALRGQTLSDAEERAVSRLNAVGFFDPLHLPRPRAQVPIEQIVALASSRQLSTLPLGDGGLAAANSLFFLNFPEECDSPHAALNQPVTTLLADGVWQTPPILRRGAVTVRRDGRIGLRTLHWRDVSIHLPFLPKPLLPFAETGEHGISAVVDRPRASSGDVRIFTPWSVAHTVDSSLALAPFNPAHDRAFVVTGTEIAEEVRAPHVNIPQCGWVIVIPRGVPGCEEIPSPLRPDQRRVLCRWRDPEDDDIIHALSAGPILVHGGRARLKNLFERCARLGQPEQFLPVDMARRGVAPTRFPNDIDLTRSPRTALGIQRDGRAVLAIVDGRADMTHSVGLTLRELAHVMKALDCEEALNLDGGGSSALFLPGRAGERLGEAIALGIVNRPADLEGVDRVLPWPLVLTG